ncbi:hypothetical protein B0H66DRAFT_609554 [Apodospora peruviana]|uniref:Uncharacterized protein n=1 Tax=Apodospora peruviana TaxID=516989 RepID=A0AAE0IPU9_9PEZI|nr:hypothetical protein B0H66DRAFT_609554 [Apodospora peruviana]
MAKLGWRAAGLPHQGVGKGQKGGSRSQSMPGDTWKTYDYKGPTGLVDQSEHAWLSSSRLPKLAREGGSGVTVTVPCQVSLAAKTACAGRQWPVCKMQSPVASSVLVLARGVGVPSLQSCRLRARNRRFAQGSKTHSKSPRGARPLGTCLPDKFTTVVLLRLGQVTGISPRLLTKLRYHQGHHIRYSGLSTSTGNDYLITVSPSSRCPNQRMPSLPFPSRPYMYLGLAGT